MLRDALVRAGAWEYRWRFWIVGALFAITFAIRRGPRVADGMAGVLESSDEAGLRATFVLSAVIVALAAALRTWGTAYLVAEAAEVAEHVAPDAAPPAEAVAADGPYRHLRNPLYLALVVYAVGIGMWGTITGWCVLVVALVVFVYRLIAHEELALLDGQGEAYAAYCDAMPNRLWPTMRPEVASRGRPARWGGAIAGELFMWGSALACVAGAVTLRVEIAAAVVAVSAAAWAIVERARRADAAGRAPAGP